MKPHPNTWRWWETLVAVSLIFAGIYAATLGYEILGMVLALLYPAVRGAVVDCRKD